VSIVATGSAWSVQHAHAQDLPAIVVRVDRLVPVPADDLQFAEERAAEVYRRIGVLVTWIDEDTAARERLRTAFTLVLVNARRVPREVRLSENALGFADPGVSRAWVLYDRVQEMCGRSHRTPASVLGDVIAHELGHLMLPLPGHSARGIMRPGVKTDSQAIETFTTPQVQDILSKVRHLP